MRIVALVPGLTTALTSTIAAAQPLSVAEVGSFKLNPVERVALPGQLFPIEAFDQFMKQGVPRWSTTDAQIQAAYNQLVQNVCPCVIVVHSQGGNFGFNAALTAPDKGEGADRGRAFGSAQAGGDGRPA